MDSGENQECYTGKLDTSAISNQSINKNTSYSALGSLRTPQKVVIIRHNGSQWVNELILILHTQFIINVLMLWRSGSRTKNWFWTEPVPNRWKRGQQIFWGTTGLGSGTQFEKPWNNLLNEKMFYVCTQTGQWTLQLTWITQWQLNWKYNLLHPTQFSC